MKNKEKFHDEIFEIACSWDSIAVNKETGEPIKCSNIPCSRCLLGEGDEGCETMCARWCESEYEEPPVDWSKVAVDTPIYVRCSKDDIWLPRYFAKFEGGKVYAWRDGTTSWSSRGCVIGWLFAKLAGRGDE